jgi:hypothetical protein
VSREIDRLAIRRGEEVDMGDDKRKTGAVVDPDRQNAPAQGQQSGGQWMDEDSTTGDGHAPRDQRAQFKHHWQSRYASGGGNFDEFAPAYDYGYGLGGRSEYQNRRWEEIEPDARQSWESDQPGTWDRFKDAIQHGWERLTGNTRRP